MPTRYLKETICTSENLAALSAEGERFWYRLLVQCDDFGRADARLAVLRAACFPLQLTKISERDIARWLAELETAGLVMLYTVAGHRYLQILTFNKHNRARAQYSKFPAPPESTPQPALDAVEAAPEPVADTCGQLPADADNCGQAQESATYIVIEDRISKSKSKSNREAAPVPELPPQVRVYEENGGGYQSGKLADGTLKRDKARQFIAELVRDDPTSLALWGRVVAGYCAMWNNKSYQIMVNDYYLCGRIPGQRTGNGAHRQTDTVPPPKRERERYDNTAALARI